ncbi:MAG: hypothetical protein P4M14_01705 [Gammaproteobacteria bacterium]|nr:hypothetical protein [Gammaproteobacteria bacterium]
MFSHTPLFPGQQSQFTQSHQLVTVPAPFIMFLPFYTPSGQIEYCPFLMMTSVTMPAYLPGSPSLPYPATPLLNTNVNPSLLRYREQRKEKRKKQRARQAAKKLVAKQQSTQFIQETLSEKISKSEKFREHLKATTMNSGSSQFAESVGALGQSSLAKKNYSQTTVLLKINAFLRYANCPSTTQIGHCNGISILWSIMMSWNVESLFYSMVKEIVECPFEKLHQCYKTLLTFFEWIDIGQNPGAYSNRKWSQIDIDWIVGTPRMNYFVKKCTADEGALEIKRLVTENTIVTLAGCDINVAGQKNPIAHAVALFYRKREGYYLFDSGYKDGQPTRFASAKELAAEANICVFPQSIRQNHKMFEWKLAVSPRPLMPTNEQLKKLLAPKR